MLGEPPCGQLSACPSGEAGLSKLSSQTWNLSHGPGALPEAAHPHQYFQKLEGTRAAPPPTCGGLGCRSWVTDSGQGWPCHSIFGCHLLWLELCPPNIFKSWNLTVPYECDLIWK